MTYQRNNSIQLLIQLDGWGYLQDRGLGSKGDSQTSTSTKSPFCMDESYILVNCCPGCRQLQQRALPSPAIIYCLNSLKEEPGGFYNFCELPKPCSCVSVCCVYTFVCLWGDKIDVKCLSSSLFTLISL